MQDKFYLINEYIPIKTNINIKQIKETMKKDYNIKVKNIKEITEDLFIEYLIKLKTE